MEDVAADPNYGLLISVTVKGPIPTIQPRTQLARVLVAIW